MPPKSAAAPAARDADARAKNERAGCARRDAKRAKRPFDGAL